MTDRKAQKMEMRLATLNINGFGNLIRDHDENKWSTMYRMLREQRIGVLMMQETHLTEERRDTLHRIFSDKIKIFHTEHTSSPTTKEGVAFILNKNIISTKGATARTIVPGRAMQLTIEWRGGELRHLLCIYAPTSNGQAERKRFFEEVRNFYEEHADVPRPHLMAGDFNATESDLDRAPHKANRSDSSLEALDALKRSLNLMITDGWRETHPTKQDFTFFRKANGAAAMSRLDRIYVRRDVFAWMRNWEIKPIGVRTDHSLVTVCMTTPRAPEIGKGRPLFPLQLLSDKNLKKQMKERGVRAMRELDEIRKLGRSNELNPQRVLEGLKSDWMTAARQREKAMMPRLLSEIKCMERDLEALKDREGLSNANKLVDIEAATNQLRKLQEKRLKLQQISSRAKHKREGERPTKYWSRLHKDSKPRELIPALERPDVRDRAGERIYEEQADKMAEIARAHYDGVQRDDCPTIDVERRDQDISDVLEHVNVRLTEAQQEKLSAELTWEECECALMGAKNGTAPGLDGIQYEVWKRMHERFKEDKRHPDSVAVDVVGILREAYLDIQEHGVMDETSFTDGWMSPIYKEKGERTQIVNYRPITLLNTDYKVLTKALAIKL
ncbi:DNase I-like protein, partial [Trametes coccinea BRFM310]